MVIGIVTELRQLDTGVSVAVSPGNERSKGRFDDDPRKYASCPGRPAPLDRLNAWYGGSGAHIAQEENGR